MADNLTPITSDQLSKVTTAKDTDLVTLGINGDFVTMALGDLKNVLGITELNTNKLGYDFIMLADSSYRFDAVNTQKSLTLERIKDCTIVFIKIGLVRSGEAGAGTSYTEATMTFSDYSGRRQDTQGFCIYASADWNCFGGASVNFATGEIIYQIAGCKGWEPTDFAIKRVFGLK